jgi:DNA primase
VLPDAREVARAVTVLQILRAFGARVRNRKRADCLLCKGSSKETLAFTERLWRCHRCNEGGDIFSLVRAVHRCTFPDALRYVAELAGIRPEDSRGTDPSRELAEHKRKRERIENAAETLEQAERSLRLQHRDRIRELECKRLKASERLAALNRGEPERFHGESEALWRTLQAADTLLEFDLPAYTLLSFAAPAERARFVLHADQRNEMIRSVRQAGGLQDDAGRFVEVLQ